MILPHTPRPFTALWYCHMHHRFVLHVRRSKALARQARAQGFTRIAADDMTSVRWTARQARQALRHAHVLNELQPRNQRIRRSTD